MTRSPARPPSLARTDDCCHQLFPVFFPSSGRMMGDCACQGAPEASPSRIRACQTLEIPGDVDAAVRCIKGFCAQAEHEAVDLLLFPECFLQGYLVTEAHVQRHAFDLGSAGFRSVAARLADVAPVLAFGMIERSGSRLYNSAVVLERGQVAGVYRKTHLAPLMETGMVIAQIPSQLSQSD